jgi:hypothetical protein
MKKLIAALALCVGTAAFATDEQKQNKQDKQAQQAPSANQIEGPELLEATDLNLQDKLDKDKGVGGSAGQDAKLYKADQAFDLKGTLGKASGNSITLQRQDLPSVDLDVSEKTVVMLDGKRTQVDQLPEGAQARVKFQLNNDDILAVRIEAKSTGATGGSGTAGKVEKKMEKAADKAEQKMNQ